MTGILNLPVLREVDMKELETEYHVKAEPVAISRLCPACGEVHRVQRHDRRSMFVRDLPTHGKTMMIHLDVPRLICLVCRKTWRAVIQEVDSNYQMTERLVRWIGRQSLEYTFAESFNAKIRRVYRDGRGYTFERLRAKVLFTDRLQKRVSVQEETKVKKKPRFEEVAMHRMAYFSLACMEDEAEYVTKIRTRQGNLGTDLPTLLALLDTDDF